MPNRNPAGPLDLKSIGKYGIRTAPLLAALVALFWVSIALAATSETKAPPLVAPEAPAAQGGCTLQSDVTWEEPTGGVVTVYFDPGAIGRKTDVAVFRRDGGAYYGFCLDFKKDPAPGVFCTDADTDDWKITYILTYYPPTLDDRLLQAAHQAAIWHYKDGVDIRESDPTTEGPDVDAAVLAEYKKITDAIDGYHDIPPAIFQSGEIKLTVSPSSKIVPVRKSANFAVHFDKGGSSLVGYTIHATTGIGSLDASSGVTDGDGNVTFSVTSKKEGSGSLTISADKVVLPKGQKFVMESNPSGPQPIAVSNSKTLEYSTSAEVAFTDTPHNVPEPMTIVLFGSGLAALGAAVAKRKNKR